MTDFNVSLKKCSVSDGFRELIPHAGFLLHTSRSLFKWPIGEGLPLAQRLTSVVWNIGCGELDFGLLLLREIGRGPIG